MLYVDVTGIYGNGCCEKPDYETLGDFLAEMDRLGIEAAVAAHAAARDLNACLGNRRLMQDIADTPGAAERILPAFTVTPKCFFEDGTMTYLKGMLAGGQVGILRIFPKTDRFAVRHLERVFAEVAKFEPVVIVTCRGEMSSQGDYDALIDLAKLFPRMKFIMADVMWNAYGPVLDAMWRCPNIYVETSFLHVLGSIQTIEDHLGSGRLIFGRGRRALGGASMAALRCSDLSPQEQAQVAGERLLSLLPNRRQAQRIRGAKAAVPKHINSFWPRLMEQGGLKGARIIDAHGHLGSALAHGWFSETTGKENLRATLLENAMKLGIGCSIVSSQDALKGDPLTENRALEKAVSLYRDRIYAYYVFNPIYAERLIREELDARFASGIFVGFKVLASYWKVPVTDPAYIPAWEYANEHHLPILFHSWHDSCDNPALIGTLAPKYPNAIFLIGHSGGADRAAAEKVCMENPNVYLEFCGSFTCPRTFRETVDTIGADRLVFGTDTEDHDPAWELGRLLSQPLTDEELNKILAGNIRGILARRIPSTPVRR